MEVNPRVLPPEPVCDLRRSWVATTIAVVLTLSLARVSFGVADGRRENAEPNLGKSPRSVFSDSMSSAYNETRSKRMVAMCGAAYCAGTLGHGVGNWDCDVCKQFPDVNASEFDDKGVLATNGKGFVAFDPHDGKYGSIVVSFSGTDPLQIQNWIDDLDYFAMTPTDYVAAGCSGCKVDRGFYYTYQAVQKHVRESVANYKKSHPKAALWITGHSLGGALAVHAAVTLHIPYIGIISLAYLFL